MAGLPPRSTTEPAVWAEINHTLVGRSDSKPKPTPDVLLALERPGPSPVEAVFLGDDVSDIEATDPPASAPLLELWESPSGPATAAPAPVPHGHM